MARCESHSFSLAWNQFVGEKLGEQMIPIIRKPTVLIIILRRLEPNPPLHTNPSCLLYSLHTTPASQRPWREFPGRAKSCPFSSPSGGSSLNSAFPLIYSPGNIKKKKKLIMHSNFLEPQRFHPVFLCFVCCFPLPHGSATHMSKNSSHQFKFGTPVTI